MKDMIITVEELQAKLIRKEPVFILDVRPQEQRNEWRISGSYHVDAYKQLNAGDDSALDQVEVPDNTSVVTVCAAGRTSLLASSLLSRKGISASSLEGGMKAWNYAYSIAGMTLKNNVKVIQVRRAAKGVLSYLIGTGAEAIVIDASLSPEIYQRIAKENGWKIKYVTDTHIHADYVSRSRDLAKACSAIHVLIDETKVDFEFQPIAHNGFLVLGDTKLRFVHTPGHTVESTSLLLDDQVIFTGDTLFIDSIGRPDLKSTHEETITKAKFLYRSLKEIFSLGQSLMVLPAHTSNPIEFDNVIVGDALSNVMQRISVATMTEQDFVSYVVSSIPSSSPNNYVTIAGLNKRGSYQGYDLTELEAGGNHCAIS